MTAALSFNATLGVCGTKFPVYGLLVQDQDVEVHIGWLVKKGTANKADDICIMQLRKSRNANTPHCYDLRNPRHILCLYRDLTAIRKYGCTTFYTRAQAAVVQAYKDMVKPQMWCLFYKAYDPRYAVELKRIKADMKKEKKGKGEASAKKKAVTKKGKGKSVQKKTTKTDAKADEDEEEWSTDHGGDDL